jgi:hypothetical protein
MHKHFQKLFEHKSIRRRGKETLKKNAHTDYSLKNTFCNKKHKLNMGSEPKIVYFGFKHGNM